MKALIFNSGLGSRLGELTASTPKGMVRLLGGETIFERQLRILFMCGIRDFIVTTGPFPEQIEAAAEPYARRGCRIDFVRNEAYDSTNYIYSMWLARGLVANDDILVLHGDLVFDAAYARAVIAAEAPCLGSVNEDAPLPEKDFKARIADGRVLEVGVEISGADCHAFQPFYKLSAEAMETWLDAVGHFVKAGNTRVYAENAANEVFLDMGVTAFSYAGHVVEEVDTPEDLERVSTLIREADYEAQPAFRAHGADGGVELVSGAWGCDWSGGLSDLLRSFGADNPLVITSRRSLECWPVEAFEAANVRFSCFSDFKSNPAHESVLAAIDVFHSGNCNSLVSIGGGSAIDIAKCAKAELLKWNEVLVPHIAIPTTAGTGSESTHFAVIYVDGEKTSVSDNRLLPDAAVLDPELLTSLPDYQKKCALLDALCQAIESYWSRQSSKQSRRYAARAIEDLRDHAHDYLTGDSKATWRVMSAANNAGRAINLTTTTAPHAMSYKLTSLYGIPHGHAVALCMPGCWKLLLKHANPKMYERLAEIGRLIVGRDNASPHDGLEAFGRFYAALEMPTPPNISSDELAILVNSVNHERLSNFPIRLNKKQILTIYRDELKRLT